MPPEHLATWLCRLATGWSGSGATTAFALMTSTESASNGGTETRTRSRLQTTTKGGTDGPTEAANDRRASWRDPAHGVHRTHGNHCVPTGEGLALPRNL